MSAALEGPSLGALIRSLRHDAGLSIEALAERSGVSVRGISDIERGVSNSPHPATVNLLADSLEVTPKLRRELTRRARTARRPAPSHPRVPSTSVPLGAPDFVGRREEITAILDASAASASDARTRVIVISGGAGMGKSTLAVEASHQLSSGTVAFIDLAGLSAEPKNPLNVLSELLAQLGSVAEPAGDLVTVAARWRELSERTPQLQVILDNAADETQLRPIVAAQAGGVIIVTSRSSLAGLDSWARFRLGPLDTRDAIKLLEGVIPKSQRNDEELAVLANTCSEIPLALRIAANRLASAPQWRASDLIRRLRSKDDRMRMLVAGDRSVEAAIRLSYDALGEQSSRLFRSLSLTPGPETSTALAGAYVGLDPVDAETLLDELVDAGLAEYRGDERYQLHELLRLFAAARLKETETTEVIDRFRSRGRAWTLSALISSASHYGETRSAPSASAPFEKLDVAATWFRQESANWWPAVQDAARLHDPLVVDVAIAHRYAFEARIWWPGWPKLFDLAVAVARELADDRRIALALGMRAQCAVLLEGDLPLAIAAATEAVDAAHRADDALAALWATYYLAFAQMYVGRYQEALVLAATVVESDGASEAPMLTASAGHLRAILSWQLNRFEEGLEHSTAVIDGLSLAASQITDASRLLLLQLAHAQRAESLNSLTRHDEAWQEADHAVRLARTVQSDPGLVWALTNRALAATELGSHDESTADIDEALAVIKRSTHVRGSVALLHPRLLALKQRNRVRDYADEEAERHRSPTADGSLSPAG